jgi:spore maturation protein CgeB
MLDRAKAPVTALITQHVDDGLDAIDSYRKYIETFLIYDSQLNFAMRRDGSRIATGRAFEVIHCGACLIQERTQDLDYYFTPQDHYFCFETFDDLMDLLKLLDREPERIQAMAAKGQAYYRAHFDDRLIIDGLSRRLSG